MTIIVSTVVTFIFVKQNVLHLIIPPQLSHGRIGKERKKREENREERKRLRVRPKVQRLYLVW